MVDETVARILANAVALLESNGVHDEALATHKAPRRILGIPTAASMKPVGRAWRLGVLLLDRDCHLFEVGRITRAIEPGRAAVNRTALGEARRADRLAASRGAFSEGDVVNFEYTPIDLDTAALRSGGQAVFLAGDDVDAPPLVRWDVHSGEPSVAPLESYLADRLALILGE